MRSAQDSALQRLPIDSFVGRAAEQERLGELFAQSRVVTLLGPGGVGKTRLAQIVAARESSTFPDGVVMVELAEVRAPSLVPNLVVDRLGLLDSAGRAPADAVSRFLRDRQALVVLDNCEHLLEACAELVGIIVSRCPGVVVLATSRQSLGVAGEHVLPVGPLPTADPLEALSVAELEEFDSTRLFLDRARAQVPDFTLSERNAPDVSRLLARLDGVPLAIELAAARTRCLSPRQIADRLDRSLSLLTSGMRSAPERHQTLRASIDGSHELCTEPQRTVWKRASVFAGSFDLAAAEQVCGGADVAAEEVLAAVDGLVDKSVLLREEDATQVRFRMLEPLRQYGHEHLADGEATQVARRHRDHYAAMIAAADREWLGPQQERWTVCLRKEQANLRTALEWSILTPGEAEIALRMAMQAFEFWAIAGRSLEARGWIDRALAAGGADMPGRAAALSMSALYAVYHSAPRLARERLDQAAAAGDPTAKPHIEWVHSFVELMAAKPAVGPARDAAVAERERGDLRGEINPLFVWGVSAAFDGDLVTARASLHRMLAICDEVEESCYYRAMGLYGVALVEANFGDVDEAAAACREAMLIDIRTGNLLSRAYHTDGAAWIAARRGDHRGAARLFGAADRLWKVCAASPDISIPVVHQRFLEMARAGLSEAEFDAAFAAGRELTPDEAVDVIASDVSPPPAAAARTDPLTPRERETASLVAQGLTNREIAERLVIAPRTVDTHVQNILNKLGFNNRALIAAWAVRGQGHAVDSGTDGEGLSPAAPRSRRPEPPVRVG